MSLTSISIKNFKNIDEKGITIPVAPITLLFGPNNAGKSTIIQALHLAREVFCAETPDFDKIKSYDKSVNIGKFVNYVHNHDITRTVSIKLEFKNLPFKSMNILESFNLANNMAIEFDIAWNIKLQKPMLSAYTVFINNQELTKFTITPSADGKGAEIIMLPLNIKPLVSAETYEELVNLVKNYTKHDIPEKYKKYDRNSFVEHLIYNAKNLINNKHLDIKGECHDFLVNDIFVNFEDFTTIPKDEINTIISTKLDECSNEPNSLKNSKNVSSFFGNIYESTIKDIKEFISDPLCIKHTKNCLSLLKISNFNPFYWIYIYFRVFSKLPLSIGYVCNISSFLLEYNSDIALYSEIMDYKYDIKCKFSLSDRATPQWGSDTSFTIELPTKTIQLKTDDLRTVWLVYSLLGYFISYELNKILYMGPIRDQIPRGPISPEKISDDKWAHGSAVWDLIATAEKEKLELLNSKILQLGLHYQVNLKKLYALDESSTFKRKLESLLMGKDSLTSEDIEIVKEFLEQQTDVVIKLENTKTKIQTEIKDMGLGISQVLPILGATVFAPKNAFIAIEEPESHIHPKMQVNLGDIIIESALGSDSKPFFLIETHSEHLMLRLLRRIRETSEGELPDNFPDVSKDDISVNYIYSKQNGETTVKHLPITDDGDFATRWPHGFFDERDKELF